MASHKYVPEWMQARSDAARAGWETRWQNAIDRGDESKLGPKGFEYFERNYGMSFDAEDLGVEYGDVYDFEGEY